MLCYESSSCAYTLIFNFITAQVERKLVVWLAPTGLWMEKSWPRSCSIAEWWEPPSYFPPLSFNSGVLNLWDLMPDDLGCCCCWVAKLCLTLLQPHGLYAARLFCPWDFPGKNIGVGCHFPSPGDLPGPGIEPTSPALAGRFFINEPPGKQLM